MALQSIGGEIIWPGYSAPSGSSLTTLTTLDGAGDLEGFVYTAKEDMTISHVGWRSGTATGSPTVEIRVETVDSATGLNTGTLWATNTNVTSGTISSNTWNLHALTASATITKGQSFAVIVKYASGTSVIVSYPNRANITHYTVTNPYRLTNTSGVTASSAVTVQLAMAVGSSATTFYTIPQLLPISATSTTTASSSGAIRAICLRFQVPFKCRVIGMRWCDASPALTDDYTIGLYTGVTTGSTELSSSLTAFPDSYRAISGSSVNVSHFDNSITLDPATWYRAVIQADTTGGPQIYNFSIPSADYSEALPQGAYAYLGTRDSGGTWTDYDTIIPNIDIIIDQLDDGASAGGGGTYFSVGG